MTTGPDLTGRDPTPGTSPVRRSGAHAVEVLQQLVGSQLDVLVPPLGRAVDAGDQPGPVHAPQVAVDEGVARLGLVVGALGETEVPGRVVLPRVRLEVGVLRIRTGLGL